MIDRADSNGDSAVSMDDFYNIMTKKTFTWKSWKARYFAQLQITEFNRFLFEPANSFYK